LRARLSLDKRRKTKGNFFRTLLRVCSNSHRNSSARAHGRFLSTTSRVDTLLQININVDFMFASTKSLVSSKQPVLETSFLATTILPFSFSFVFCVCFFSFAFLHIFFLLLLLYHERANALVGTDDSLLLLLFLFFDDDDDRRNVVFLLVFAVVSSHILNSTNNDVSL
jgi:hypothetical protein